LSGSQAIVVKQGTTSVDAQLFAADPSSDRCVLTVLGLRLVPVQGVRSLLDLKIGETALTIAATPAGDSTVNVGTLLAIQQENGKSVLQTSNPASLSASGAGVFDGRGQLMGITQSARPDQGEQALSSAIPADSFYGTGAVVEAAR
jgi:hypothetical protein